MIELWEHQKKAVAMARTRANVALLMGMGTGKTATMIQILREDYSIRKALQPTLIFSPISVCAQWKKQFEKFSKIDQGSILVLTGPGSKRTKTLETALGTSKRLIVCTNYESVQIKSFYELLLKWSPEIVVLDESHLIKDADSVRAKKIYPLGSAARRRFILTGTPVLNSLMDLYGQYKFLEPQAFGLDVNSTWKFRTKFFYNRNAGKPAHVTWPDWQPLPHASKLIGEVLSKSSVQAKKDECMDLPPLVDVVVPVEMGPAQAKAYREMEKHFVTEMNDTVIAAEFAITKCLRLRQILAGFGSAEKDHADWFKDVPGLDAVEDILSGIGKEKVILWTNFKPTYQVFRDMCDRLKIKHVSLTGDETYNEKEKSKLDFKTGDANVLISNPSAGGTGLDIPESSCSIYYDLSYNPGHYRQSRERNYRGGSETHKKVTHYYVTRAGTLDEVISKALIAKENVGNALLNWAKNKK